MAHHSGSRSDLLDHDHTAAIYEHGLAYTNNQPYTFVRMCDGKFVRTAIPIHDFEALDSALTAAATAPPPQQQPSTGYYRSIICISSWIFMPTDVINSKYLESITSAFNIMAKI